MFLCDITNNFERYTACELIRLKLELNDLRNLTHFLLLYASDVREQYRYFILVVFCIYSTRLI